MVAVSATWAEEKLMLSCLWEFFLLPHTQNACPGMPSTEAEATGKTLSIYQIFTAIMEPKVNESKEGLKENWS
jgi:hypothetical protein